MTKRPPHSRRLLRQQRRAWARRNASVLVGLVAATLALLAFLTVVLVVFVPTGPVRWYLLGAVHAGVAGAAAYLIDSAFLANDRTAIHQVRGTWGEENTRSELERAKRKKLIWGWVDSIDLHGSDIDHLVVTRDGGIVAIDSKWRTQTSADDRSAMVRSAHQSRVRAEGVINSVLDRQRRGQRAAGRSIRVRPVVAIWGPVGHEVPDGAEIDGVRFLGGRRLLDWLRALDDAPVDKDAATDILRRIEGFRVNGGSG